MSITNYAVGEQIVLSTVLNTKLEKVTEQTEVGLNQQATATGQVVRWDEWALKHNNDGSFKGINQSDMNLTTQAASTGKPVRWDEFSQKHNNDGTFKTGIITNEDINSSAAISPSKLAIQKNYKKSSVANPSATANTDGSTVSLLPPTGYVAINPMAISVVFGGTFVGAESVTAKVVVTYGDDTSATVTKVATAVEGMAFSNSDLMDLIKDDAYIKQLDVKSQSNTSDSTVTVTFNHCGFYL